MKLKKIRSHNTEKKQGGPLASNDFVATQYSKNQKGDPFVSLKNSPRNVISGLPQKISKASNDFVSTPKTLKSRGETILQHQNYLQETLYPEFVVSGVR